MYSNSATKNATDYEADSIGQIYKCVKEIASKFEATSYSHNFSKRNVPFSVRIMYRGQRKVYWKLQPGIMRANKFDETTALRHLKMIHHSTFDKENLSINDLSRAQHYGLSTRLLDFSGSLLSAIFFAVEKSDEEYDFLPMKDIPARGRLREKTIYHESRGGKLKYMLIDPQKDVIEDTTDMSINGDFDKNQFLDEFVRKGYIQEEDNVLHVLDGATLNEFAYMNEEDKGMFTPTSFETLLRLRAAEAKSFDQLLSFPDIIEAALLNNINLKEKARDIAAKLRFPIAVFPNMDNPRIIAQDGRFVIWGGKSWPAFYQEGENEKLHLKPLDFDDMKDIEINNSKKKFLYSIKIKKGRAIKKELEIYGIHRAKMYQSVDDTTKWLNDLWRE